MLNNTRKGISLLIALCMALAVFAVVPAAMAAAPVITSSFVYATTTSLMVNFTLDIPATIYYSLYAGNPGAKTGTDVKAGVGAVDASSGSFPGGSHNRLFSGLTPNTQYTAYFVAENDDGFSNVEEITLTTLAASTDGCVCEPWIEADQTMELTVGYGETWTEWFHFGDDGDSYSFFCTWWGDDDIFDNIATQNLGDGSLWQRYSITAGLPVGVYTVYLECASICDSVEHWDGDLIVYAESDPVTFTLHVVAKENPLPQPEPQLPSIISSGTPGAGIPAPAPIVPPQAPQPPQTGDGVGLAIAMAAVLFATVAALWVKRRVRD